MKFLENVGRPSYFRGPLRDWLCHVFCRSYSPFSVEVVEKNEQM